MTFDPAQLYDWLARFGFPGAMALFIFASYKGIVGWKAVWDAERDAMRLAYDARIREIVDSYSARLREIVEEKDERIAQIIEERNTRVAELLAERDEFLGMVIGGQRNLAKSLDAISEITTKVEPKQISPPGRR